MTKDDTLQLVKDGANNRALKAEINEMILAELYIDSISTHTNEPLLYETLASLTVRKISNQE